MSYHIVWSPGQSYVCDGDKIVATVIQEAGCKPLVALANRAAEARDEEAKARTEERASKPALLKQHHKDAENLVMKWVEKDGKENGRANLGDLVDLVAEALQEAYDYGARFR